MPTEPTNKRLVAFVDGQALYHAAREAFGHVFPDYDVTKLAQAVADLKDWQLVKVYFYTGIPEKHENPFWHEFWAAKLAVMGTRNISTFTRPLRYSNKVVPLKDGTTQTIRVAREKGIDLRLALDAVRLAWQSDYDVALIFSQDQDLSEAVDEIRMISRRHRRWLKVASAYPSSATYPNDRGINGADWIKINKAMYNLCLDPIDYRPKPKPPIP